MDMNDNAVVQPIETLASGPLSRDLEDIVNYVKATRLLGEREARRYVGRRLTRTTLANWRRHGRFPVGFRNADAVIHDDSGAEIKTAARAVNAARGGRR